MTQVFSQVAKPRPGSARLIFTKARSGFSIFIHKNCYFYVFYLDLESEVFLEIFDNHDKEGELDAERLLGIGGAGDVRSGHIGSFNLEHQRLDIVVCDALDVSVAHFLVPNLQRFRTNTVQNGQESTLKCGFTRN